MYRAGLHLRLPQRVAKLTARNGRGLRRISLVDPIFHSSLAVEPENFLNRVLLVADHPTAGAIIREKLSAAGYDVLWARNRVEAGVLWQPSYYDVVLLDLRRDPEGGVDLVRRIKATDPAQRIIFLDGRNGTIEAA